MAKHHTYECEWHLDQYDRDCTCGAIVSPALQRTREMVANLKAQLARPNNGLDGLRDDARR